jgi:predicted phage terminase large subunit-like protein
MSIARKKAILQATLENKYLAQNPTMRQAAFLINESFEALFGGAAGGGKSSALLMAALQYVDEPKYSALLLRRTYADLAIPGALIPRSKEWLMGTDAHWNDKEKKWTFPNGATIKFGYLENTNDIYNYQSSEFQFIGFDELTHFTKEQYEYMFSRLRKTNDMKIPLRMRAGSNPGGRGHEWVYNRFFVENHEDRVFIPSKIDDNPHLNKEEYLKGLSNLDSVTRAQLEQGDWTIRREGALFKSHWFEIVDNIPSKARKVRYWDLAGTEKKENNDPDYTAGCLLAEYEGIYYVCDMRHFRASNLEIQNVIRQTAEIDGKEIPIYMEQEPGSSGKSLIDEYARRVLNGFAFYGDKPSGDKVTRATPVSAAAERGNVKILRGAWNREFLDEVSGFPLLNHDDQVDTLSGSFSKLNEAPQRAKATRSPF